MWITSDSGAGAGRAEPEQHRRLGPRASRRHLV